MITQENICIVTTVHNKRYIKHFKTKLLKSYIKLGSKIPILVCTNCVKELEEITIKYPQIKLFETNNLRSYDTKNKKYENLLDADKKPKTYANYPWNIRRHIIRKGFEEGYTAVWWLDSDVCLKYSDNDILDKLNQYNANNSIIAEGSVYAYSNKDLHLRDEVVKVYNNKNWNININDISGFDGPSAFYIGKKNFFFNFINKWSAMTTYSYKNNVHCGRIPDSFIINIMFVVAQTGINIINTGYIFSKPKHNPDDRYN